MTCSYLDFMILSVIIAVNSETSIDDTMTSFTTFNGILSFNDDRVHKGGSNSGLSIGSNTHSTSEIIEELKDYLNHYIISHEIGKGTYGRVFKAFRTIDGQFVAIKVLIKSPETITDYIINTKIKGHTLPNLVQTIATYESENYYIIIMNLYKTTLKSYIEQLEIHDNPEQLIQLILKLLHQISDGVLNLKTINNDEPIALFDIKPQNIYLDDNDNFHVADLGLGDTQSQFDKNNIKGTPLYISRAFAFPSDSILLDTFDINSLSLTAWEILCRQYPPFQSSLDAVKLQYQDFGLFSGMNNRDRIIMEHWYEIMNDELNPRIKELYQFILKFAIFDLDSPEKYSWTNFKHDLQEIINILYS